MEEKISIIRDDELIIRKTYNPNHAKLYLFRLEEGQVGRKNLFITGSSNLTRAGLTTQEEFNVEISDFGFDDAEQYFDALWEEAVKITEHEEAKRKLIEVVEKETLIKEITPFEAFVLVLKTYLDSFESCEVGSSLLKTLEENGYTAYQYQLDAVKQALGIIENNNGVIIADVVGLGKTIIACSVAKELKKRGIVICPPGLVGDRNKNSGWKRYAEEFKLYDWEVRSLGDLENITDFVNKIRDIEVVIVDEAHRFRNQDTKDYEYLKNICRNKIVILLTATPFDDLIAACRQYSEATKRQVTFEYILIKNVTCTLVAAEELARHLKGMNCKMNLIPYNRVEEFDHEPPTKLEMLAFKIRLAELGIHSTVRMPRGRDVAAACGQLRHSYSKNSISEE